MKIRIKTSLVKINIKDSPTIGSDNYTKRTVPDFTVRIESAITQAIKLHKEVLNKDNI